MSVPKLVYQSAKIAKKAVSTVDKSLTNQSWFARFKSAITPDHIKAGEGFIPDSWTGGQPTIAALTGSSATKKDIVRAKKEIEGYSNILVEGGPEKTMLNVFKAVTPDVLEPVLFHGLKTNIKPFGLLTGSIFGHDSAKQKKQPWHQYSFDKSDVITENDFDPQMLHAYQSIYHINKNAGINQGTDEKPIMHWNKPEKGIFNYRSYNLHAGADSKNPTKGTDAYNEGPLDKFFRPGWLARYMTGSMNYEAIGDGTIRMTDTFDFNDPEEWLGYSRQKKDSLITNKLGSISMKHMKDRMRIYANYYGAKGSSGREIDFNIDPNKNYLYGTEFNTRVPVKDPDGWVRSFQPSPSRFGGDSGASMTNVQYTLNSGNPTARGKHWEQKLDYNTNFLMKGVNFLFGSVNKDKLNEEKKVKQ